MEGLKSVVQEPLFGATTNLAECISFLPPTLAYKTRPLLKTRCNFFLPIAIFVSWINVQNTLRNYKKYIFIVIVSLCFFSCNYKILYIIIIIPTILKLEEIFYKIHSLFLLKRL